MLQIMCAKSDSMIRRMILTSLLLFCFASLAIAGKPSKVSVSIATVTDLATYNQGDTVNVTVTATMSDGSTPVIDSSSIEILDANSASVVSGSLINTGNGVLVYTYTLDVSAPAGSWTVNTSVEVGRSSDSNNESFSVSGGGGDPPPTGTHASITDWNGTSTCLACHTKEAQDMHATAHYQWQGETPYMVSGASQQGKLETAVNSYCVNIKGNWNGCGACHVGGGAKPEVTQTQAQLENIDCLICHQKDYKRVRNADTGLFVPDLANMSISMVQAAQTVHKPERQNCVQCHAKGGGGDNYKRGDMSLAHANTADKSFDVHMATTGANLKCQDCHTTQNHAIAGRGSDLRPTMLDVDMGCQNCHTDKAAAGGHANSEVDRHLDKVACQSCHIGTYARNASDTEANESTEIDRDWSEPHWKSTVYHPTSTMANDLTPRYKWWNKYSKNHNLGDPADVDPETGAIPTSRPMGDINDGKLYPFKYKTASQPYMINQNKLIALDTSVYFVTADLTAAVEAGLVNMGYSANEPWELRQTDTFQLITHEVMEKGQVLGCSDCHESTSRMDLKGSLGYEIKDDLSVTCTQCHREKRPKSYGAMHSRHVDNVGADCSYCHNFSRPEKGLTLPPQ